MKSGRQYILDALKIHELYIQIENNCTDDNKNIEGYTLEKVLKEAKYVLSTFYEGGHINNEDLNSDDEEVRKDAEKQVKQLENYIKKYSKNNNSKGKRKSRSLTEEQKNFLSELKQGDKILLNDGDIAEFVKLNRVRFVGIIKDEEYNIPVSMVVKKI